MTNLLVSACEVLEDINSSPALKAVAGEALLVAWNEGLAVPKKAPWAVWCWLKTIPGNRSWRSTDKMGAADDARVREDALLILDTADVGDELRGVAVDVLSGAANALHVGDDALFRFLDRAATDEHCRQLGGLLEAVHRARGVSPSLLRAVRDRWASSRSPAIRETSILVASELIGPDVEFIEMMLADPNADVRACIAHRMERGMAGAPQALGLIENRLRVESHDVARTALLGAQASLIDTPEPRRRRR